MRPLHRPVPLALTPFGLLAGPYRLPATIGRAGLTAHKSEGDGATPRGVHRILGCLYRPDRVARPAPWARPIGLTEIWSDDPDDPAYNKIVRAPLADNRERLHRADPLYDIVLFTDWNLPDPVPGKGSAIFLHRWRRPGHPTAGCIGLAPAHIAWLASVASPGTPLVVR